MTVLTAPLLLDALQAETRALHAALERESAMARLLASDLSRTEYAALLAQLLAFYAPLEARLAPFAAHLPLPLPHRSARLRRDLDALGWAAGPGEEAPEVPEVGGAEAAIGVSYVLEGAALGGQVITRAVQRTLGLDPAHGLAFFASEGLPAGPRWRTFRHFFSTRPASEAAVSAAQATFSALYRWLKPR